MKKEDFVQLLEGIIERKIKAIVPKMIKEELKNIKPLVAQTKKSSDLDLGSLLRDNDILEPTQTKTEVVEKKFLKNPVINKLLNETAHDMKTQTTQGGSYYDSSTINEYKNMLSNEYSDMGMAGDDLKFDSNDIVPMSRTSINEKTIKTEMLKQEVIQKTGGNEAVANAMIKDYSNLLKAVDKKTKSQRPM